MHPTVGVDGGPRRCLVPPVPQHHAVPSDAHLSALPPRHHPRAPRR
jgi:hypothetical protein